MPVAELGEGGVISAAETLHKMAPHWVSADVIRPPSNRTCRWINCILPEYDQNWVQSASMVLRWCFDGLLAARKCTGNDSTTWWACRNVRKGARLVGKGGSTWVEHLVILNDGKLTSDSVIMGVQDVSDARPKIETVDTLTLSHSL